MEVIAQPGALSPTRRNSLWTSRPTKECQSFAIASGVKEPKSAMGRPFDTYSPLVEPTSPDSNSKVNDTNKSGGDKTLQNPPGARPHKITVTVPHGLSHGM